LQKGLKQINTPAIREELWPGFITKGLLLIYRIPL
jgi:hypothetical protein